MKSRQHLAAAALFVALAVAFTWPLARLLNVAVAWPGDPYINTWILDWDWWATFHRPLSLFDANAFYPAHDALAFSENLYGVALILFPFRAAGVPPLAAYNVAMLLGYAFSGFAAYLLGRYVTGSWWAGIAAGIFYAFVPFRTTHNVHVQHVWGGWLPMMLLALLHYTRGPSWKRASLFAAALLMNGLTNIHWLLFGTLAIAVTIAIVRPRFTPLAVCTLAAFVLLAPFLWPYLRVAREYGMRRGWRETKSYSAMPRDWLVADPHYRLYTVLADERVDPERWLFPGALSILLSIAAVLSRDRRALGIGVTWLVLGFFGSLGLHAIFHRFLFRYAPGFRAIRVPARWANIAYVGMALLIALGVVVLARERKWLAAVFAAAFAIELCPTPVRWYLATPGTAEVYRWIGETKPNAVLELPMSPDGAYAALINAPAHHRPLVNGISGFVPPESVAIERLTEPMSDALIPELRRVGVDTIVAHADSLNDAMRAWIGRELAGGRLVFVRRFDGGIYGDWVFSTRGGTPQKTAEVDAFLRYDATYNRNIFGYLDIPRPGETIGPGGAYISGFAFSPFGVREANLLFQNHAVRIPAFLSEDPRMSRRWPWYGPHAKARFQRILKERPPGVRRETDMQVEIVDGRGRRTLFDDRQFIWP